MRFRWKDTPTRTLLSLAGALTAGALLVGMGAGAERETEPDPDADLKRWVELAPARGYIAAHRHLENPRRLLGGPIRVNVAQNEGGVFVGLPDERELGEHAFGTPDHPRAFAGTPVINGVPPGMRTQEGDEFGRITAKTPFGDKHIVLPNGRLSLQALDVTATDAARTEDEVRFRASWQDNEGNTYEVRCCEMLATHGMEFPTFGGVVTNTILHGFTRIGTALMPSEYTYVAFWGMGAVLKNGEVQQKPRLVHGMLTEYVRTGNYELAHDAEVNPEKVHFHLMVPPMMPVPHESRYEKRPVQTGFTLPNGVQLPFWHVMFENLDIRAERTG